MIGKTIKWWHKWSYATLNPKHSLFGNVPLFTYYHALKSLTTLKGTPNNTSLYILLILDNYCIPMYSMVFKIYEDNLMLPFVKKNPKFTRTL